jgi:hypothetical protein
MHYNLICILYALLCGQKFYSCKKWVLHPMEVIPEQETPVPHVVVLIDVEPVVPQLRLYHALMKDYEENLLRLEDDFDHLDNDPSEDHTGMDE